MATAQHAPPRAAANPSRPLQPHAPAAAGGSPSHASASPLSVFLTNLRLLDLDLRPDWPGISPQMFATGGAGVQGQKKRIHCVEWALFHLLSLWDPAETAAKLKPLFPPLDQRQSLSLRAALLRALESAKKNGMLGRDCIIRKTMLDDCKGERLEEVLASLSTSVLKRAIARDTTCGTCHPAIAVEIASENRGYRGIDAELTALVLAHRVSLRGILQRKKVARARYGDFARLLEIKERAVARRNEEVCAMQEHGGAEALPDNIRKEMCRTVGNNWSGNEKWMEALLLGDAGGGKGGGLLAMPFDRVWRRVQQGRLAELQEEDGGGLLEQLDSRVRIQRERLERWDAFRREIFRHQAILSPPKPPKASMEGHGTKGIDLGLCGHHNLQLGTPAPRAMGIVRQDPPITEEYEGLVDELKDELAEIRKRGSQSIGFLARHRTLPPIMDQENAIAEVSDLEDGVGNKSLTQPSANTTGAKVKASRLLPMRPQLSGPHSPESLFGESSALPLESAGALELPDYDGFNLDPPGSRDFWEACGPPSSLSRRSPPRQPELALKTPSEDTQRAPSPRQDQAGQIRNSMDNTSPSLTKHSEPRHTLSLAERTRLSMAQFSKAFTKEDGPEPPVGLTAATLPVPIPEVVDGSGARVEGDAVEDLVSRTRRSMAGFEKAKQKAQLERRRSQRSRAPPPRRDGSFFPRVDEEAATQEENVLAEELMRAEDMEAVFRSRPKIKASPVASPTRERDDDVYELGEH